MLKKRSGFSLVELIIAISLLASIGLLVGLNFNKIFNKEEQGNYEEFVNKIKSASDVYLTSNNSLLKELNTNRGFIEVKIKDLKDAGLISDDLTDPKTGKMLDNNQIVLISLDDSGTVKFIYPAEKKEEYLQTLNMTFDYNSNFDCLIGLDTINLGLIDKNGHLIENYFTNNPDKITCKTEVNTKEIGSHLVKYSYVNQDGVTKEATRNFIVIDHIHPTITNLSYTPSEWTSGNVTISANINDLESGIVASAINLDGCGTLTESTALSISKSVSKNGIYSVCAKDKVGNITEEKITISNIDKTPPTSFLTYLVGDYLPSLTFKGNFEDSQSKVIAYAINTSKNVDDVSWINTTPTDRLEYSHTITANGTYYFWAKDKVGNVFSKSVVINNIATFRTISFLTPELSSQNYSGIYNASSNVKKVQSITTNTGNVDSYSISGSTINYSLKEGAKYSSNYWSTCSYSAQYKKATLQEECNQYLCPSGGSLSGNRCTGSEIQCNGHDRYSCHLDSGWLRTYYANNTESCGSVATPMGYIYNYKGCATPPSGPCTVGEKAEVLCLASMEWRGDYDATCTGHTEYYSCPSDYSPSGTNCYKCNSDDTLFGSICEYDCIKYFDYYQYQVTITYAT